MKKYLLISVFVVMIISFGGTFYIQHQAFSEQKTTMRTNFNKEQKRANQQIKELQNKNAELEKTIKTNVEKTNALQSELDSAKAVKEQTVAASQETAEVPVEKNNESVAPQTQQEEAITPVIETPKVATNAAGQTREERENELMTRMNNGDTTLGYREILKILLEEFPQ